MLNLCKNKTIYTEPFIIVIKELHVWAVRDNHHHTSRLFYEK